MSSVSEVRLSREVFSSSIGLIFVLCLLPGIRSFILDGIGWTALLFIGLSLVIVILAVVLLNRYKFNERDYPRNKVKIGLAVILALGVFNAYIIFRVVSTDTGDTSFWLAYVFISSVFLFQIISEIVNALRTKASDE